MPTSLDVYTLHQGYLESYKDTVASDEENHLDEILAALIVLLLKLGYTNLGDMPKRKLNTVLAQLSRTLADKLGQQSQRILDTLQKFVQVESALTRLLVSRTTDKPLVEDTKRLDNAVFNSDIANAGMSVAALLKLTVDEIIARIRQQVKVGVANNMPLQDLVSSLVGTQANKRKDGVFGAIKRKYRTNVNAVMQHASSIVSYELMRRVSDQYTWVAVLDSRTTEVCRSRNGHTYMFGEGPRPPAHWNCRSFIVPVTVVAVESIPTYYTFIKRQPAWVQDDFLGVTRGRDLRKGSLKSEDLPGFDNTRPLTLATYKDKLTKLIREVA